MTVNDISTIYETIEEKLYSANIAEAFFLVKKMIKEINEWDLSIRVEELARTYKNMLDYKIVSNSEKNEQDKIYKYIVLNLFIIADNAKNIFMLRNSNLMEYEGQRLLLSNRQVFYNNIVSNFDDIHTALKSYYVTLENKIEGEEFNQNEQNNLINDFQKIMLPLFANIFLKHDFSETETEIIKNIVSDKTIGIEPRCIAISALTLNILRHFSSHNINILLSLIITENIMIRERILIALVLIVAKHGKIIEFDEHLMNRITFIMKDEEYNNEIKSIIFQIIRTTQTGEISKQISEEIMPEIIRISPKLQDQFNDLDADEDTQKLRPRLEDIFEGEGISDKLQDFAELQMSGADVYAATFSEMKNTPFFSFIENWFMPFTKKNPYLWGLLNSNEKIMDVIAANPMLCNSDKFSFSLNIMNAPQNQLSAVEYAIREEKEQFDDMIKSMDTKENFSENKIAANLYILDLYRFFKFFPRPHNFKNPNKIILEIYKNKIFDIILPDPDDREKIAEYFYQFNHYKQAIDMYSRTIKEHNPELTIYQNIAYAFQQTGMYQDAINYYILAESLDRNNSWYLHRMAFCHRKMGNLDKAIALYNNILEIAKEDYKIMFRVAMCYFEKRQYEEALTVLYKIDYLKPEYPRIKSVLMLTLFYCGKLEEGRVVAEKIVNKDSEIQDVIIAGHIELALGQKHVALNHYKMAIYKSKQMKSFISDFKYDKDKLIDYGVNKKDIEELLEVILIENFF